MGSLAAKKSRAIDTIDMASSFDQSPVVCAGSALVNAAVVRHNRLIATLFRAEGKTPEAAPGTAAMRPLGYVLIVFNLIAAGAFVYFGVQDWKGRQEINTGVLKHILILRGVPFEGAEETVADPEGAVPLVMELTAGNTIDTVSPALLDQYYQQAPAGDSKSIFASNVAMPSQLGELKRVRGKIKEAFDAATTPKQKIFLLYAWLELGVETYTERVVIQNAAAAGDWGTLTLFLDKRFEQVEPKLLEGATGPLSSEHWEKLTEKIESLNTALAKAEAELKSAETEAKRAENDQKQPLETLLAEDAKLRAAQMLLERAKQEKDLALEKEALAEIAQQTPIVKAAADAAQPLLVASSEKTRQAEEKRRKVAEVATEIAMLQRPAVPDEAGRRTMLSHLLVHLDQDVAWQKRVMLVVGIRQYVKSITSQASRFRTMVEEVDYLMRRDQEAYTGAMGSLREQAIQRTRMVMEVTDTREKQEKQRDKDLAFVKQRESQLTELEMQLTKVKAAVAALLGEQTSLDQELFVLQREIAVTLEEVYELQDELREAEKKRFTIPK